MEISRVVFFCPDKKVGQMLRLLTGIALETPEVTPVVNAVKKGKKLEQETNGKASTMFAAKWGKHEFTKEDLRGFLEGMGRSRKSDGTVLQHLYNEGLARPTKKRGVYIIK